MAFTLKRKPGQAAQHHPTVPIFERVQDWVFRMDIGTGAQLFRFGMFGLLLLLVVLVYTGTQFYGLRDPEAMDTGQLARNLWQHRGYVTKTVRPLELWYLNAIGRPPLNPRLGAQPELWTPPVYPGVLAAVFRVIKPDFTPAMGPHSLQADRLLMVIAWGFYLAGLLLLYVLSRELFDERVAVLAAFLYLFCEPLLNTAVSGLSLNFLTVVLLLMVYGVVKAEKWQQANRSWWLIDGALVFSALLCGIGTLTAYAFASLLLPLLVYVRVSFPKRWRRRLSLCLLVFVLTLVPWMARNWRVSRTLFGLTRYQIYEGVGEGTPRVVKPGQLQRSYGLDPALAHPQVLPRKTMVNLRHMYEFTVKDMGGNYLIAFFLAALLHRFRNETVFRLRRLVFWSLIMCVAWLSVTGPPPRNFLTMFMPLIILYAAAFFYVLFERLQFRTRLLRRGMIGTFVVLNSLPVLCAVLPPHTTLPYPPYDANIITRIGKVFDANELMASDIPWAVAWYADRTAVWAPYGEKDYMAVNGEIRFMTGVYLTQATLQQLTVTEMMAGQQRFWLQLFHPQASGSFPLTSIQAVTPDGQQVLLSDRRR